MLASQQPQQFELRDVGVLEFIHQDVAAAIAELLEQLAVGSQELNRLEQLRAEGQQVALAQQGVAGPIDTGNFLLPREFFFAQALFVGLEPRFLALVSLCELVGVALVILRSDQLILTARKELHEVAQELAGLGQAAIAVELEQWQIPAEQDPVVNVVEDLQAGVARQQHRVQAKRMKRGEPDLFAALTYLPHHAVLHLCRGLVRKRQPEDLFAGKLRVGLEQPADTLGDHAGLARACPSHYQQRPFAVPYRRALLRIQQIGRVFQARQFCDLFHVSSS